jgi:predicted ABC-type ATPase
MAGRSPYQLTEQENSRIYKDRIEPILLASAQVSGHERPRLIMLGGQPGSGKTFLLRDPAEEELAREGGAISIDADEMRNYHPVAESLKNEDDQTAARHTHPDAAAWVNQAIDTAIRERCHVVLDGTMGSPKSAMKRLKRFEDAGYNIEVRVLAISHRRSWLNVLRRYEDEKSRRGAGRMTPREVHDEAYDGLVKSIEQLVSQSDVRLRVYSRDREIFDSNVSSNRPDAPHVLTAERNRPWAAAEQEMYGDDVKQLVTLAQARDADAAIIDGYQRLMNNA